MKKTIILLCLAFLGMTAQAQLIKPKQQDTYTLDSNGQIVKKGALIDTKKKTIDPKYLAGACPEVDGKVTWTQTIEAPGMSAKAAYDRLLPFFMSFCKEPNQTEKSNVTLVDETQHQIVLRVQEWLVFEDKLLSLDRTKFNYLLVADCKDGSVDVTIRNISYVYDEDRGGGYIKGEDMLTDENALNKKGDGFNLGGHKKFRTKTIDRKDQIMQQVSDALK